MHKEFYKALFDADGGEAGGGEAGAQPPDNGGEAGEIKSVFNMNMDGGEAGGGEAGAQPPELQVPEKYEFKLAEGLEINDETAGKLTEIAKKGNMTQETVDALLELHGNLMLAELHAAEDRIENYALESQKQGLCTKEKLADAASAVAMFGGDEAMNVLIETGAINHPAVLRMFQTIQSFLKEDAPPAAAAAAVDPKTTADLLFPNSKY